jgi:outer membrane protein TolC
MQEVETQLAALRIYEEEAGIQNEAADLAERGVVIALNRYQAGIDNYTNVVVAKNNALSNQQKAIIIAQQRLNASVLLVKALGGSWTPQNQTPVVDPSATTNSQNQQNTQGQKAEQGPGGQG